MKIRRIEMAGFKSFADRTTLIFSEGLSGVVGSNGCGKSNVVDAVRWCLGEQSAKSMRGNAMQDVIFSGTQQRNPVNKAEVSIVFGPGDTPFKGDFALRDEIQITRRIERDGPSQYFINQQRVRLKDVQDVFLDSGLSNHRYSFIEQGQIGDIVNARPAETRQLIEEAAGISRYQQRRADALARLEGVDTNLNQMNRVLHEHDRRLRAVAKQVKNAWLHRCYSSKIQQLTCLIEMTDYAHLVSMRRVQGASFREAEQTENRVNRKLEQHISVLYQARNSESGLQNTVNQLRAQLGELESERREKQTLVDSAVEEIERINEQQVEHNNRHSQTQLDMQTNRKEHQAIDSQYSQGLSTLNEERKRLSEAIQLHNESTERIRDIDSQIQQLQVDEQNVIRAIQQQDGFFQAAQLKIQQLKGEQDELEIKLKDVEKDIHDLETQKFQLIHEQSELDEQVDKQLTRHTAAVKASDEQQKKIKDERIRLTELDQQFQKKVRQLSSLNGEIDGVMRIHKRYDGLSGAAKSLLNHPLAKGVLADKIRIPEALTDWAAVVLSGYLDAVLCDKLADVKELVNYSSSQVIVLALDGQQPCTHPKLLELAKDSYGARALNAILPEYDEVDHIEDVSGETAWVKSCQAVVRSGVMVRAGKASDPALEFIARARRLEELQAESNGLKLNMDQLEQELQKHRLMIVGMEDAAQKMVEEKEQFAERLRELKNEQGNLKRNLDQINSDINRKLQQKTRDSSRTDRINADIVQSQKHKAAAQHEQGVLKGRLKSIHQEQDSIRTQRSVEMSVAAERSKKRNGLNESVNEKEKKSLSLEQMRQFLEDTYAALASRLEEIEGDKHKQLERRTTCEFTIRNERTHIAEIIGKQKLSQAQYEKEDEKLAALRERIKQLDEQNSVIQAEKDAAYEVRVTLELKLKQLRESIQKGRQLLMQEFKLNAAAVLGQIERNGFVTVPASERLQDSQLPEELSEFAQPMRLTQVKLDALGEQDQRKSERAELQSTLVSLGDVNQTAVETHLQLEDERLNLAQQYEDLFSSAQRIRETIEKLNVECVTRFGETFEAVNGHFQEIYPRLVGGGRSELELCEPKDLLNTGVEIYAQPPGKRLQSLKPLSGGEKAMVAISLLFALFRVKPSPFCLLDEVDAPLDEGNGMRFNTMLAEMAEKSQFIVITHNKKTMEVMDTLYGVSMPVQGVSQIVSVELN
ncbi:MAG: chromosome segregation protein SMC [Myxococcota bacterium]|nr:chromosome segregation protein SMC [Myxococcota bacterium]